jgi:drug/metabolite transporter (DMT)-like permease
MSAGFGRGLVAAIAGAVCYGAAPAVQAVAARREVAGAGVGARLTLRLSRRPIWLAGLVLDIGGFALEAYAFSNAPATFIAPVMACDMIIFVMLGSWLFHERLTGLGVGGIAVISAGVVTLAVVFAGRQELGGTATNAELIGFLVGAAAFCALAAVVGSRAAAAGRAALAAGVFSAGAGISYGLAAMATRQVGRAFDPGEPWHLLATPTPYVLAGCSVLAITLMQRGLQTNALLTFPVVSAVAAMLPVGLSAAVLDDQVPGGWRRLGFVVALVLIAGGVVLLGRDRAAAEKHTT